MEVKVVRDESWLKFTALSWVAPKLEDNVRAVEGKYSKVSATLASCLTFDSWQWSIDLLCFNCGRINTKKIHRICWGILSKDTKCTWGQSEDVCLVHYTKPFWASAYDTSVDFLSQVKNFKTKTNIFFWNYFKTKGNASVIHFMYNFLGKESKLPYLKQK